MFCHNGDDMIYLWLTPIVRRRLNSKWLVLPTLPTSRSVRNLFRWKKTFFTTKVFMLISSLATPSSAGDWGNSRGCHSWLVQPNPAGWGGSRFALCSGSSHVRSYYITSYCIMANRIISYHYTPQRFQVEMGSEMKEEEEVKETNWGEFLTLNYQIGPCVLSSPFPP